MMVTPQSNAAFYAYKPSLHLYTTNQYQTSLCIFQLQSNFQEAIEYTQNYSLMQYVHLICIDNYDEKPFAHLCKVAAYNV